MIWRYLPFLLLFHEMHSNSVRNLRLSFVYETREFTYSYVFIRKLQVGNFRLFQLSVPRLSTGSSKFVSLLPANNRRGRKTNGNFRQASTRCDSYSINNDFRYWLCKFWLSNGQLEATYFHCIWIIADPSGSRKESCKKSEARGSFISRSHESASIRTHDCNAYYGTGQRKSKRALTTRSYLTYFSTILSSVTYFMYATSVKLRLHLCGLTLYKSCATSTKDGFIRLCWLTQRISLYTFTVHTIESTQKWGKL